MSQGFKPKSLQFRKPLTFLISASLLALSTGAAHADAQQGATSPAPAVQATTTQANVTPSQPTVPAEAIDPKERIVCKQRVEIGTRLGKRRECLSVKQWEEIRARSAAEAKRMQRNMGDKRG